MPSINDISEQQAINDRLLFIASEGCVQAERLRYGLPGCFDKLIKAKLELEMLEEVPGPVIPELPPLITYPTYVQPGCAFQMAPLATSNPFGTRNGRRVLIPGLDYPYEVQLAYEQNDADSATAWQYTKNGGVVLTNAAPDPGPSDQRNLTVNHSNVGIVTYKGRIQYAAGPVKNDSTGAPYPVGQIGAGFTECGNTQIEFDYPLFYGYLSLADYDPDLPDLTDLDTFFADLEHISAFVSSWNQVTIPFSNLGDPGYLWFAVPANRPVYQTWFQAIFNQGTIGAGQFFDVYDIVNVDFGAGNIPYRVYVSANITEASGNYIMTA